MNYVTSSLQGPSPLPLRLMMNASKFTSLQICYPKVGSKVVQGPILMYIKPINDFRIKWMLQDE